MSRVRIGDKLRIICIPPDVHDEEKLPTRTLFEKCVGKIFTGAGLETVEGLPYQPVRLGHILGQAPDLETIGLNLSTSNRCPQVIPVHY